MKKITITLLLTAFLLGNQALAQVNTKAIKDKLENYFKNYKPEGAQFSRTAHLDDLLIDDDDDRIVVVANDAFAEQSFTPQIVEKIYSDIKKVLPSPYDDYYLQVETHKYEVHQLVPKRLLACGVTSIIRARLG